MCFLARNQNVWRQSRECHRDKKVPNTTPTASAGLDGQTKARTLGVSAFIYCNVLLTTELRTQASDHSWHAANEPSPQSFKLICPRYEPSKWRIALCLLRSWCLTSKTFGRYLSHLCTILHAPSSVCIVSWKLFAIDSDLVVSWVILVKVFRLEKALNWRDDNVFDDYMFNISIYYL